MSTKPFKKESVNLIDICVYLLSHLESALSWNWGCKGFGDRLFCNELRIYLFMNEYSIGLQLHHNYIIITTCDFADITLLISSFFLSLLPEHNKTFSHKCKLAFPIIYN